MENYKTKKYIGVIVDLAMYILLVLQMCYVITGNDVHEWLGMGFFVCLIVHLIIKKNWFKSVIKRKFKPKSIRGIADLLIVILIMCLVTLIVSSVGVSRTLFPDIKFFNNPYYHRWLATAALTIAVIHGGMHALFKTKKPKKTIGIITVCAIAALCLGAYGVPYLNRHMKVVEITNRHVTKIKQSKWTNKKPLVVYFTRLGNTDFDEDIDAVSSASLLLEDGALTGNNQFIAKTLEGMLGCDTKAITLTEYKYPSSYAKTCQIGGEELKKKARPKIEPIDVSGYDDIILIYPIWWGTIPMPVATFLEENDFRDKDVYFLATQGSRGFASSITDGKKLIPDARVHEAISIYCEDISKSDELLKNWIMTLENK